MVIIILNYSRCRLIAAPSYSGAQIRQSHTRFYEKKSMFQNMAYNGAQILARETVLFLGFTYNGAHL